MGALSKEQKKFLESTASKYADHLDLAEEWLTGRGINMEHAQYEGLGVVTDPPALHQAYRGRLSIPYITDFGPVKMSFRCLKDHECKETEISPDPLTGKPRYCSKYIKERGSTTGLYGVRSFDDATDWIGVSEGELDSIILRQIGIPAVAIPGAGNWEDHWPNVFEDLSRIYVFADADKSGEELFQRLRDKLDLPVLKVKLPSGEDVNSTYLKYGAQAIVDRIKK